MAGNAKGLLSTCNEVATYAAELSRLEGKEPNPYGEFFKEFVELVGRIRPYTENTIKEGDLGNE